MIIGTGETGAVMIADAVRYMSVDSRKQPDSRRRSGTTTLRSTTARIRAYAQATGRFAGGGRCWVRTNVG
jgi:hypothetical protein